MCIHVDICTANEDTVVGRFLFMAMALLTSGCAHASDTVVVTHAGDDRWGPFFESESRSAAAALEVYFDHAFQRPVTVSVLADRAAFDAEAPAAWGVAPSQCWMVGVGAADRVLFLSPTAWAAEACDHKPDDADEARSILRHEMVHVYHGQFNPTGDFSGMDEVGWFVEGLAVLVSDQLDARRMTQVRAAVADDAGPTALADAWSGPARYGVGGSMVRFIETTWGRPLLFDLMAETSNAAILSRLGLTEQEFLTRWRTWLSD